MPYILISTQIRLVCSCVFVRVRECFVAAAATAAFHRDALELGQNEWRLQDVLAQEHRARVRACVLARARKKTKKQPSLEAK